MRQHVAALLEAAVADHERSTGPWEIEWIALPEIFLLASGALAQTKLLVSGLEVDAARMRANLDLTRGMIVSEAVMMGLGPHLGRQRAHDLVYDICRKVAATGEPLVELLAQDAEISKHLTRAELDKMCDPAGYLGLAGEMVDRVLAREPRSVVSQHPLPVYKHQWRHAARSAKTRPRLLVLDVRTPSRESNMNIDGKVIVITGAARGIGQEYARYLGGLGARIVAADINDCSSTLDLVKAESGTAVGAKLDVASAASAMDVARAAVDAFGRIDALINNAALMAGSRAAGSTPSANPIGTRPWP